MKDAAKEEADSDQAEIERCKKIDIEHLKKIHQGIMAYLKKYGHYPEQLSQLVPEFITADVLQSPRKKLDKSNAYFAVEHADTGIARPSYAFEFSNIEYRDGRTFAEIKEVQRTELGDVVPMLRSFAYDKVINVSCRGDVYETQLNWEWDSATLDLADMYGWGPGLSVGDMVRVRVLLPDGSPANGAKVWADGRNYSFDLPNRPFTADSDGWVTIPVGVDTDRTALVLRAERGDFASATSRSQRGNLPQNQSITLAPAESIGGTVVGYDGKAMPGARVFLQSTASAGGAGSASRTMMNVRADSNGHWSAQVHPDELAAGLEARIGEPAGTPFKSVLPGSLIDSASAKAGRAVVTVAPSK
ncbi:MAG: hypothetical protein NTV80_21420 [Verrucomicrobia bacterium]|nr:hypothetical protein [Verrucomicrobiota bacterium]